MRSAYLEDARPADVSHAVRDVLERRGALVNEHVSTRVRFQYRPTSGWSWTRSGYVGIYQPYGEKDVEVRLLVRARWPHRLFWMVAALDVVVALATFLINPPGTQWFVIAFLAGFALLLTGLVYVNTWRHVHVEEDDLMQALDASFRDGSIAAALRDEATRRTQDAEAELAGEVEKRRLAERKRAEPKPEKAPRAKFSMPKITLPGRKSDDSDDADEKRRKLEELRARKAELERDNE